MYGIRKTLQKGMNYQLVRCFLDSLGTLYGEKFMYHPGPDGFTTLLSGIFCWLINICPGYLVFRQGSNCTIEPYLPSRSPPIWIQPIWISATAFVIIYMKGRGHGITSWLEEQVQDSICQRRSSIHTPVSVFVHGISPQTLRLDIICCATCIRRIKAMYQTKKGSKSSHMKGISEFLEMEPISSGGICWCSWLRKV